MNLEHESNSPASKPWTTWLLVVTLVFMQRLGVTIGNAQVPAMFFVFYAVIAWWLVTGRTSLERNRSICFAIGCSCVTISYLYNLSAYSSSLPSFIYLLVMYLPWLLIREDDGRMDLLSSHQFCVAILAVLGLVQFATQIVGVHIPDPFNYLPDSIVLQNYFTDQPITYGSSIMKSNGFFGLEPSYYSKWLATAFLVEILWFKRPRFLALFAIGILPSFSGTGLIVIGGVLLLYLRRIGAVPLLGAAAVLILGIALLPQDFRDAYQKRLEELSDHRTSASVRFVTPYTKFYDSLDNDSAAIFGHGPGSVKILEGFHETSERADALAGIRRGVSHKTVTDAYGNTAIKVLYEYGLLLGTPLLFFVGVCFFSRCYSYEFSFGLFIMYMFLTGALLEPHTAYYCYSLSALFIRPLIKPAESGLESATLVGSAALPDLPRGAAVPRHLVQS